MQPDFCQKTFSIHYSFLCRQTHSQSYLEPYRISPPPAHSPLHKFTCFKHLVSTLSFLHNNIPYHTIFLVFQYVLTYNNTHFQLVLLDKKLDQMLYVCNAIAQKTQLPEIRNPEDHVQRAACQAPCQAGLLQSYILTPYYIKSYILWLKMLIVWNKCYG